MQARPQYRKPLVESFLSRVMPEPNTGCWLWMSSLTNDGYGQCNKHITGSGSAHKASYLMFVGDIASGLEIDHLCRVRSCCNPAHMRLLTHSENMKAHGGAAIEHAKLVRKGIMAPYANRVFTASIRLRSELTKTRYIGGVCKHGHSLTGDNYYDDGGTIRCRQCARAACNRHYARRTGNSSLRTE